ncbi:MAG TPA: S1/P1 nuclease [Candidatus Binataceae bacterium]|nr:S1/P1 nuclease [Candidatus Binataceae bacterium]
MIADEARRPDLRGLRIIAACAAFAALTILGASRAFSWDSRTHRMIAHLAVGALPPSALKTFLAHNEWQLEGFAVAPDTILAREYGHAEKLHHYIDLEDFGPDPFAALVPDYSAMQARWGEAALEESGTLPWTIEARAAQLEGDWRAADCAGALTVSGYLAHYIGDASQPLHTTVHFDGYPGDYGLHARLESTTDYHINEIAAIAAPQVHLIAVNSAWDAAISEIRQSHQLVSDVIAADRAARAAGPPRSDAFEAALMSREEPLIATQIARGASVLASVWLYEWNRAGNPAACAEGGS